MANLYTKKGDKGETGLYGGSRVSKASRRVNAYGVIDEANSALGLAYALSRWDVTKEYIRQLQDRMFIVAAEIASDDKGAAKLKKKIGGDDTAFLEKLVDDCTKVNGMQTSFVMPGVNAPSAALHVARTVVRRAERELVALSQLEPVPEELMRYVNRLSDAVYALARLEETMDTISREVSSQTETEGEETQTAAGSNVTFDLRTAQELARRAGEKAGIAGVPIVFAAVDESGNMILHQRMPGALPASMDIAAGKAFTAFAFRMPTHELYEQVQPGAPLYGAQNSNDGKVIPFGGGYPVRNGEKIIGAIGISGGTVEEDMMIAEYALRWLR